MSPLSRRSSFGATARLHDILASQLEPAEDLQAKQKALLDSLGSSQKSNDLRRCLLEQLEVEL